MIKNAKRVVKLVPEGLSEEVKLSARREVAWYDLG